MLTNYFNYKFQVVNIITKKLFGFFLNSNHTIPDGLITYHNKSFFYQKEFSEAYIYACNFTGHDFKIPYRIHQAIWAIHSTNNLEGHIVELGTGKGFTFSAILKYFAHDKSFLNRKIYLYDLFQQPDEVGIKFKNYEKYYSQSPELSINKFAEFNNVNLVVGDIFDTLKEDTHEKISFLHIDLNFADIEIHSIKILFDKLSVGAIVLLDDYANAGHEEQYKKWQHFARNNNLFILNTPSGQGLFIKS